MGGHQLLDALDDGAEVSTSACSMYTVQPGYRLDNRVLTEHICNLITDGSLLVLVDGRQRTLSAGGALWIGPGVRHSLRLPDPARPFSMLNLRFAVHRHGRAVGLPERALLADDAWGHRPLWELAIDDRQRGLADRAPRLRHILALLHGDLRRCDAGGGSNAGLGRHRRMVLERWVAAHLARRPTPSDLARVVGLSPDWFRRAFTRTYRLSPRAWLVRERVRAAAQRLADRPDVEIAALAAELGYADHRLLDRQFRAVLGRSPSAWRRS